MFSLRSCITVWETRESQNYKHLHKIFRTFDYTPFLSSSYCRPFFYCLLCCSRRAKVTRGRYVGCSYLCVKVLQKLGLTERNNPGEVNYTGRAYGWSHRRLKCDVINAACRRRRLPFPTLSLSLFSLTLAQVRSYTRGKSRKNSTGWERTLLSTLCREGVRKMKNQCYQRHGYLKQNPLNY